MITKIISDDKKLITHLSDKFFIKKVGTDEIYYSATDLNPTLFVYEETDILLVVEDKK